VNVPDYISPIVGHRVWQWDAAGLKSLCGEPWPPGKPLAAGCRHASSGRSAGRAEAMDDAHEAPQAGCTCGVYAAKSLAHLRTAGYTQYGIHGEVFLWGTVVEHETGWRAQFAYPKNFFLSPDALPFTLAEIQSRLKMLTTYRIDIFVAAPKGNIPLWAKDSAYSPAGLDYLIKMGKRYYDRRRQEQTLKKGDRVAILGRGIAVVERADGQVAEVVLWSRATLRIPRNDIVWDRQNMRWEADAMDVRETGNCVPSDR
jgi:hypothetical protein